MKRRLFAAAGIVIGLAAITAACGGDKVSEPGGEALATPTLEAAETTTPAEKPTPPPEGDETPIAIVGEALDIIGKDIQFDKGKLTVAADTPFTVVFDHQDEGINHNFAIYETPAAENLVAGTEIEPGPVEQRLPLPEGLPAGSYFYRCDVHPTTMTGILEVK